jgi:hypothetical protein
VLAERRVFLALAVLSLVACAAGCGTRKQETTTEFHPPADTVEALALEVERQYLEAAGDSTSGGELGSRVESAVRSLLVEIVNRDRPAAGWQATDLEGAIQQRGLVGEVRELDHDKTPWLVTISGPGRPTAVDFSWLVNPATGGVRPISPEPFRNPYQLVVWPDSAGRRLLVTGRRRSPAGQQPAAWLFRVPQADSTSLVWPEGSWGLSGVGSAEVNIVRLKAGGAPRIAVTRAVLPNPLFDECPSCPHLEGDLTYRIEGPALVIEKRRAQATPYAAFVHFIEALSAGDSDGAFINAASADVVSQGRSLGLDHLPHGGRWRIAPGSSATSIDQIYLRGDEGAVRVLSAPGDSGFVITSISPTTFTLD